MSKKIAESFGSELVAANCNNGVSFTVGGTEDDIQVDGVVLADATGELADAVRGVVDAHDATKQPTLAPTLVEQILASPDDLAALKKALGI